MNRWQCLLIFLLSLSCLFIYPEVSAQTYVPGVASGDWFRYKIDFSSDSSDFLDIAEIWLLGNQSEWMEIVIREVSGTEITFSISFHFANGTDLIYTDWAYWNVEGGAGDWVFVASNLGAGDVINPRNDPPTTFNGTYTQSYPNLERETNYLTVNETTSTGYYYNEYHFDKETGAVTEIFFKENNFFESTNSEIRVALTDSSPAIVSEPKPTASPSPEPSPEDVPPRLPVEVILGIALTIGVVATIGFFVLGKRKGKKKKRASQKKKRT
ncbi:hypothetical protein KAI12_03740 [Candidatus Bathyarchaeota archaeon]|nr:hypothetical protein [Candidatus Bathyarchaeota archaeon]